MNEAAPEGLGILDAMRRRKGVALSVVALVFAVGIAEHVFMPPLYRANATIMMSQDDVQTSVPGLGGLLQQQASPLNMLAAVLESESTVDEISRQTKVGRRDLEYTVRSVVPSNTITVSARYRDKDLAIETVTLALDILKRTEREVGITAAAREAQALKGALADREKTLQAAESALLAFSQRAKTAPDPESPYASIDYKKQYDELTFKVQTLDRQLQLAKQQARKLGNRPDLVILDQTPDGTWKNQVLEAERKLRAAEQTLGPKAPELQRLRADVEAIRGVVRKQVRDYIASVDANIDPKVSEIYAEKLVTEYSIEYLKPFVQYAPVEALEFQRLLQRVLGTRELVKQVAARYENARLKAEVGRVRWLVLDKPYVEYKPVNKSLSLRLIICAVVSLILAAIFSVVVDRSKSRKAAVAD